MSRGVLWLAAALATAAILAAPWRVLDLTVSGWFYHADGGGFWLRDTAPMLLVSRGTRYVTTTLVIAVFGLIAYGRTGADAARRTLGRRAAIALLALIIGPGIIVHPLLKDQMGRPRPAQIADFGGTGHYVPPGVPSTQCDRNCSFVSGHAASGYLLAAGALIWPRQRRRWLAAGAAAGTLIGTVRIVQGAHFLSDILGSAIVVLGTVLVIERYARRRGWLDAAPA